MSLVERGTKAPGPESERNMALHGEFGVMGTRQSTTIQSSLKGQAGDGLALSFLKSLYYVGRRGGADGR